LPLLLAKPAEPGAVKTRLIGPLSAEQAAEVHGAMLRCVIRRVSEHLGRGGRLALADGQGGPEAVDARALAKAHGWAVVDQGAGDLGQRLAHVWHAAGDGPVVFFGVDSPDLPAEALQAIGPALKQAAVAVGPVADGGYWTLAANQYEPALLTDIPWGSGEVYARTQQAAEQADLSITTLPAWYDVDDLADLQALAKRLNRANEPALVELRQALQTVCGPAL
jgi:rSAM/selenodomain-associated transferase 1